MLPMAKASLSAGASGIMLEVHPNPGIALSDQNQQMNFDEMNDFIKNIQNNI